MSSSIAPNILSAFQLLQDQGRHVKSLEKIYNQKSNRSNEFHQMTSLLPITQNSHKQYRKDQNQKQIQHENIKMVHRMQRTLSFIPAASKTTRENLTKRPPSSSIYSSKFIKQKNKEIEDKNKTLTEKLISIKSHYNAKFFVQETNLQQKYLNNITESLMTTEGQQKSSYQTEIIKRLKTFKKRTQTEQSFDEKTKTHFIKNVLFEKTQKVVKGFYKQSIEIIDGNFVMTFENQNFKEKLYVVKFINCQCQGFQELSQECSNDYNIFLQRVVIDSQKQECHFLHMNQKDYYHLKTNKLQSNFKIQKEVLSNNKVYEIKFTFLNDPSTFVLAKRPNKSTSVQHNTNPPENPYQESVLKMESTKLKTLPVPIEKPREPKKQQIIQKPKELIKVQIQQPMQQQQYQNIKKIEEKQKNIAQTLHSDPILNTEEPNQNIGTLQYKNAINLDDNQNQQLNASLKISLGEISAQLLQDQEENPPNLQNNPVQQPKNKTNVENQEIELYKTIQIKIPEQQQQVVVTLQAPQIKKAEESPQKKEEKREETQQVKKEETQQVKKEEIEQVKKEEKKIEEKKIEEKIEEKKVEKKEEIQQNISKNLTADDEIQLTNDNTKQQLHQILQPKLLTQPAENSQILPISQKIEIKQETMSNISQTMPPLVEEQNDEAIKQTFLDLQITYKQDKQDNPMINTPIINLPNLSKELGLEEQVSPDIQLQKSKKGSSKEQKSNPVLDQSLLNTSLLNTSINQQQRQMNETMDKSMIDKLQDLNKSKFVKQSTQEKEHTAKKIIKQIDKSYQTKPKQFSYDINVKFIKLANLKLKNKSIIQIKSFLNSEQTPDLWSVYFKEIQRWISVFDKETSMEFSFQYDMTEPYFKLNPNLIFTFYYRESDASQEILPLGWYNFEFKDEQNKIKEGKFPITKNIYADPDFIIFPIDKTKVERTKMKIEFEIEIKKTEIQNK